MSISWESESRSANRTSYRFEADMLLKALAARPDNLVLFRRLYELLLFQDRKEEALELCQTFLSANPEEPGAHIRLANLHQREGRWEKAISHLDKALQLSGPDADLQAKLGLALIHCNRTDEGERLLHDALTFQPDPPELTLQLNMKWAIQSRNSAEAIELFEQYDNISKRSTALRSLYSVALREVGRLTDSESLVDYDSHIHTSYYSGEEGDPKLEQLNTKLEAFILNHPRRQQQPGTRATTGGQQVSIDDLSHPTIATLFRFFQRRSEPYIQDHDRGQLSSYFDAVRHSAKIDSWAVLLQKGGYEESHIHPSGRVSGVYYVKVPEEVSQSEKASSGWLELGRPSAGLKAKAEPHLHYIKPEEGLLVLFPSYLYHRTIPLETDELRISIAFDVVGV